LVHGSIGRSRDGLANEEATTLGPTDPVAAAARAARVFLFLLPGGRPRRGAEEGAAVAAFFPSPHGRPGLCFSGTSMPPVSPAPGLPMADMVGLYSSEANEEEGRSVPSSSNGPSI
jgi:hypothetical protein